ncbi:MAG: tRNA (adenosine(37)-N6)-dimethylallyltransferase MiaA [Clostridia bacterium]|nr:tRNA (adenosine(37)-N6)-dimethylallyltransferase MiaA [Clostridia bacterium]
MNKKIPVIAVVGPTASGKTALGVHLAKTFNGEVISGDSMQIYKELSVATAKPTVDEMQGIPHHLIDIKSVSEEFSVADYSVMAKEAVDDIISRGKLPVIVGGTGLYIDSFLNNIDFSENNHNDEIRAKIVAEMEQYGPQYILDKLYEIDEPFAKTLQVENKQRLIRALEICYTTGKTVTQNRVESRKNPSPYNPLYIGINYKDRQVLYDRINLRVDKMVEQGIVDEAKMLFSAAASKTAVQAIGCKEFKPYLDGNAPLDVCIEDLKTDSRRYAKRQLTWFNRNENINWIYPDEIGIENVFSAAEKIVLDYLKEVNDK